MPLIACPDCNRQVSDRAPACPDCGGPIASTTAKVASSQRAVTLSNQKYAMPALLQFFIPLPGIGQYLKGHSAKGSEFLGRVCIMVPIFLVLAYFFEPFRFYLILIAVAMYFISWGQSIVDAYNSHDDDTCSIQLPGSEEKTAKKPAKKPTRKAS